jgi:phosphonate transport system substrate-binding protein
MISTKRTSRRSALALLPGAWLGLRTALDAAVPVTVVRLAISETMVSDVVNLNDARAAMTLWLRQMMVDVNINIVFSPKVFDTTEEIERGVRNGDFDCVALNAVEYRPIAEFLDSSQILAAAGSAGMDRYVLLAKRNRGIERLADLKGRNLLVMKHPKMCVAKAWLSTLLEDSGNGPSEQFFRSVTEETRPARVVLPVFFGQADACLTYGLSFDTMCELNPQVEKGLVTIAASPAMVVVFYLFRKGLRGTGRDALLNVYAAVFSNEAGKQLSSLFQFASLVVRTAACIAPAMAILEKAARIRSLQRAGGQKG